MWYENPILIGIIVGIPSFILGYLGYLRSVKVDKVAEKSGAASTQIIAVNQVVDSLDRLVENLQEDNKILRGNITELITRLRELSKERDELEKELFSLRKKYIIGVDTAKEEIKNTVDEKLEEVKKDGGVKDVK